MKFTNKINLWGRRLHIAPFMFSHHGGGFTIFTLMATLSLIPVLYLCGVKGEYNARMGLGYVFPIWCMGFAFFVCCFAAFFGTEIQKNAKSADGVILSLASFCLEALICTIYAVGLPCLVFILFDRPPLLALKVVPGILHTIILPGGMSLFLSTLLSANKVSTPLTLILTIIVCYSLFWPMTFVFHI